jgi:hypothetical protein
MKKVLYFFSILALTSSAFAQDMTEIKFETISHNFGQIKEIDGPVSYKFVFTNVGDKPFVIQKVDPSCGCTTPAFSKEPVKPGKQGFVQATFNPKNKHHDFHEMVTVVGNSKKGDIRLQISGYVVPRPRTIVDDYPTEMGKLRFKVNHVVFGDIYNGDLDTAYIELYNQSKEKVVIKSIEAPQHVLFETLPKIIMPEQEATIEVYYSSYLKGSLGYVFDRIQLVTDDESNTLKELIVVANIVENVKEMSEEEKKKMGQISFEEIEYNFGDIQKGEVVSHEFNFKNIGEGQLIIYDTESNCGCTSSTMGRNKYEAGENGYIKIVLNSKTKEGLVTERVKVKTSDPYNPETVLIIKANVLKENK